jgi:hypothetical protein
MPDVPTMPDVLIISNVPIAPDVKAPSKHVKYIPLKTSTTSQCVLYHSFCLNFTDIISVQQPLWMGLVCCTPRWNHIGVLTILAATEGYCQGEGT